jgi:hemin uptake protein HemP
MIKLLTSSINKNTMNAIMTPPLEHDQKADRPPSDPPQSPKVISTQELFAGAREIRIKHAGEQYVLRITRRNKLILQK